MSLSKNGFHRGLGAAALMLAVPSMAWANASALTCTGTGGAVFTVNVEGEVCMVGTDPAVKADKLHLECHYQPPVLKVFHMLSGDSFEIVEAGAVVQTGTCVPNA